MEKKIINALSHLLYIPHIHFRGKIKVYLILSFMSAGQLFFNAVYAQNADSKLVFGMQNETLEHGLNEVGRLTKFRVAFALPQVNKYTNITIEKKSRTLKETLNLLLENTNLTFVFKDKSILVIEKTRTKQESNNGKYFIFGSVTDLDSDPLPGVSIRVKGNNKGTVTDVNGKYALEIEKEDVVVLSYIGFNPREIKPQNGGLFNVVLSPNSIALSEVSVVSTGYQTLPKERATGAFGTVTAKDLKQTPAVNIMERLEGTVPGVNFDVRNNTITVRGKNSFNNGDSNSPLIVIDGFPTDDKTLTDEVNGVATGGAVLSRINPEDIESITILKDAAAASIWGAKAANGVIVIETKKGKRGTPTVNFSTSLSVSAPADLNKLDRMNSAQYIALEKELKDKGFVTDPNTYDSSWMSFNQNKPVSTALEWMFKVDRGTATATEANTALDALSKVNNYDQIKKYLLQNAVSQQYNLSLSGGGPNNTYYISSNYTKDVPVYRSNSGDNYFLTVNLGNSFLNNRVNLKTGINYNYSKSVSNSAAINALGTSSLGLRPYDLLVDANGSTIKRSLVFTDAVASNFLNEGYLPWTYSAVDELNYSNSISKENRLHLTADLNVKLTDWANVSVSGSLLKTNGTTNILDELNSYNTRNFINTGTSINASTNKLVYGVPYGGQLITNYNDGNDYSLREQLNINKSWDDKISLNFLAGSEIRESTGTTSQQTRYGYDEDTNISKSYDPSGSYMSVYGWTQSLSYNDSYVNKSIMRFLSYYSNASVGFMNNKYIVSGSARFDDYTMAGYSRSKRAKPLWSSGVKWNMKSEDFLKSASWLNALDLRGSVGTSGSIPSAASNIAVMTISGNNSLTNETYGSIITPADGKVSWELTTSFNFGVEWAMFNNRLKGTFDFYSKNTKDIMYLLPVNSTYGWSSLLRNGGTMSGHGIDLGISGSVLKTHGFEWNSAFNLSCNTNKVTDSRFTEPGMTTLVGGSYPVVGLPLDYVYAYRWAGLDKTGQSQIYDSKGNIISSTTNTTLTSKDLKYMGRTTPPFFGGFTNSVQYKDFSLSAQITYAMGHVFRRPSVNSNNYPQYSGTYSGVIGTSKDLANRWQNPGDEATTNVPGLEYINSNSILRYQYSDLLTESASNIRLRQVALNYFVPAKVLSKTMFKSVSAGISVRNLGLLWVKNKEGIDPDYVNTKNYSNLPPARNYYFTLNVSF